MKRVLLFCLVAALVAARTEGREWFVRQAEPNASDTADGSAAHPLRTINAAAQLAQPGDIITVGAGIYHEWISPARGGSATAPILYRSMPQHAAIVRGTDVLVAEWQPEPDAPGLFAAPLPQAAFIFGNPFIRPAAVSDKQKPARPAKCNALVFSNDAPLSQVTTRTDLAQTANSWLSSDDGRRLLIHLSGNSAPLPGAIEVTTRDRIFAPHRRGLGYIHVEGFVFERCATRPDWPQLGALSTRTGQYWSIRNNIVRCTTGKGIDCGSETWGPESLIATEPEDKHVLIGGHHLVEGNLVTGNAQCGIAAWNTDEVRIIGNIVCDNGASASADNLSLTDFEAAGIKVHAFRNGLVEGNLVVSNSSFGIWLDNGWENARVTRNVIMSNRGAGIFVELGFGPVLVDHNLCAANGSLGKPYFGDGIYTHDASGITISHNTFLDNAHYGVEQLIVSERVYWPKRLAEASNETITGNLFYGNRDGAISLPLLSPRSHDNQSDHNAVDSDENFVINNNNGRIPPEMILRESRERLQAAEVPEKERPDLSDPKRVPELSLLAWQVVMQMDQSSTVLPGKLRIQLDQRQSLLQIDLPTRDAVPVGRAGPTNDVDLLGQLTNAGEVRAGAIQHLHEGTQTVRFWPLPAETVLNRPTASGGQ
ncbi:MAG TPA: right-handed parallel beta-helix repeat-containing protein [Candidatus Dormibacteraeota bacterium]|nr:right-handed parallel beta-helix repeat-containing protein [Candidatus Dormibacteraeota bacterium]